MGTITALGVGLAQEQMTFAAAELLKSGARVMLHTERIGCADWLRREGIAFEALDFLYDECENFDEHALRAANVALGAAQAADVVYVVYDVRDRSVVKLSEMVPHLRIIAGPPVEGALMGMVSGATRMLEASDWEDFKLSPMDNALVREIDSRALASEVKLKLMECYPDETRCFVLSGDGSIARVPLYDLDRLRCYDHRSCALIPAQRDLTKLERFGFDELVQIMHRLQGPDGCPWDREQTHESLCPYMLEEIYEAIDAVKEGDSDHLYDELGDVMMLLVMQAEIGKKRGEFDMTDSISAICEKMISRHSHIFGSDSVTDGDSVLDLWMRNKMKERGQQSYTSALREVSRNLPALMRAAKLLDKAKRAGVGEKRVEPLIQYALEKLNALTETDAPEKSVGELMLSVVAIARACSVDGEIALNRAADRFIERFAGLEASLAERGLRMDAASKDACENWAQVKL